jgi:hypothetical protein
MQVTAKVTDIAAITVTELAHIEIFLTGLGAVALAVIAFYYVHRWSAQSTNKRDTLDSTTEQHK